MKKPGSNTLTQKNGARKSNGATGAAAVVTQLERPRATLHVVKQMDLLMAHWLVLP